MGEVPEWKQRLIRLGCKHPETETVTSSEGDKIIKLQICTTCEQEVTRVEEEKVVAN